MFSSFEGLDRRKEEQRVRQEGRLPPGQSLTLKFPVLHYGPVPPFNPATWDFRVWGEVEEEKTWSWEQFNQLPRTKLQMDIHCVTRWSKFDTVWEGVSLDTLLGGVEHDASFLIPHCDGGYTTNLPIEDATGGQAWIAFGYDGEPLAPEHGGPARLLVPHLYFWKSAKWIRGLELSLDDRPGFWEELGYHNYGDPWQEQRYQGD